MDWTGNGNSIFKTLGASNHTDKDRQSEDFYATSPIAIQKLAEVFPLNHQIWEPACGNGCLSKWMVDNGHDVVSTDLVDRGYGKGGVDFLKTTEKPFNGAFDIVTNPPYIRAKEFILHGLELIPEGGRVIMFLKTTFLEGKARKKEIYDITPPVGSISSQSVSYVQRTGILTICVSMAAQLSVTHGTCSTNITKKKLHK